MGFAPLHTDPWIQVVQLAGAQGNRLRRISHIHMLQKEVQCFLIFLIFIYMLPKGSFVLPYSHACLLSGSQACPVAPSA